MPLDVARIRDSYPALAEGLVHFDGPGGTQMAGAVADAVAATLRTAVSNRHGAFVSAARSDAIVAAARQSIADLVGGSPDGVVLGPNMTTLTYALSRALAKTWGPGDEVLVSRLDHDANVRPWVQAARSAGAAVRWAEVDLRTGELPTAQYADLVGPRTRLVAVTAASNAIGTRPDVPAIAAIAHAAAALVYVDGVHATPHFGTDRVALGADFYATSSYKWSGPHLGAVAADPAVLADLRPDKLVPAPEESPDRFETGTACFELLAGLTAAVDHLAGLADRPGAATGTRRERLLASMAAVEAYEAPLFGSLYDGLCGIDGVTVYGHAARRAPTVAFRVDGRTPRSVAEALAAQGLCVWDGDYYASELFTAYGIRSDGGAVRVGLYHYLTEDDVERLLAAVRGLG